MTEKNQTVPAPKKFSFSAMWKNKRLRSILLTALVVLLCAAVYVVLLFTVLRPEEEEAPAEKVYLIESVEPDQIQSVRVDNAFGGFHYYRASDNTFYFEGAEQVFYDTYSDFSDTSSSGMDANEMMSMVDSLMGLVRNMLANEEVKGYDKDNLESYGLDGDGEASLTLTYLDQEGNTVEKTVLFGNKTVSGTGFYCMVKGSDSMYIMLDVYISRCVFTDERAYFSSQVAPAISSSVTENINHISIHKHGEKFLSIYKLSEEEMKENGELFTHAFSTPDGYYPSPEKLSTLLQTFSSFVGESVLEYDITRRLSDPEEREQMLEMFRLYSLMDANNNWVYELKYEYQDPTVEENRFDVTLYISDKLEVEKEGETEGEKEYLYYIYSPDFDLIAEFSPEDLSWVEWDLLSFMDNHAFSVSIDRVASLAFSYDKTNVTFSLTGEGDNLQVTLPGKKIDTKNFRQLYKAIVYSTMDGYADEGGSESPILEITAKLRDGTSYHYSFYGITARKAYYTLNGSGQFYINRDYVKQIISACNDLLAGKEVVVDHKK